LTPHWRGFNLHAVVGVVGSLVEVADVVGLAQDGASLSVRRGREANVPYLSKGHPIVWPQGLLELATCRDGWSSLASGRTAPVSSGGAREPDLLSRHASSLRVDEATAVGSRQADDSQRGKSLRPVDHNRPQPAWVSEGTKSVTGKSLSCFDPAAAVPAAGNLPLAAGNHIPIL
jgi:hypothetical protein